MDNGTWIMYKEQIGESDLAVHLRTTKGETVWIPRSCILKSRTLKGKNGERPEVYMQESMAKKKGLI